MKAFEIALLDGYPLPVQVDSHHKKDHSFEIEHMIHHLDLKV